MLNVSVFLFAIAALGGISLATLHFRNKNRPWPLAVLHGLIAASALGVLVIAFFTDGATLKTRIPGSLEEGRFFWPSGLKWAAGLFMAAAAGGLTLFSFHLRKQRLPSPIVLIHGGVAIIAFLVLLSAVYLGNMGK